MKSVGIKVLKNKLSEYVRLASAGETILISDRDQVVAELTAPREERSPLMADAMKELKDAGLVDETTVTRTAVARDAHLKEFFAEYTIAQKNRTAEQIREQRMEARAAMGPGVDMINCITGERYTT